MLNAIDIMTENYPPFNYQNRDNKIVGITTDIVREILKDIKSKDKIIMMPWARGYKYIINKPNKILFSMTRTPQREYLFKWVGPIISNSWVFYARADSKIKLKSLDDAKSPRYKIGTYMDDALEVYLKQNNFYNIHSVPQDMLNLKKLIRGRINLWATGQEQALFKMKRLGINPNKITEVFKIKKAHLYIAFSRTTPDSVINLWQSILNKMKKDGRYKKIVDKYLK
jgi:polar amino acid transport system substrate-binding protein